MINSLINSDGRFVGVDGRIMRPEIVSFKVNKHQTSIHHCRTAVELMHDCLHSRLPGYVGDKE